RTQNGQCYLVVRRDLADQSRELSGAGYIFPVKADDDVAFLKPCGLRRGTVQHLFDGNAADRTEPISGIVLRVHIYGLNPEIAAVTGEKRKSTHRALGVRHRSRFLADGRGGREGEDRHGKKSLSQHITSRRI